MVSFSVFKIILIQQAAVRQKSMVTDIKEAVFNADKMIHIVVKGWKDITDTMPRRFLIPNTQYFEKKKLTVVRSFEKIAGDNWLHVSVSAKGKIPTYNELTNVKKLFIGDDQKAIQIFPKEEEHVNIQPNTLHLYTCLTRDPLPDFRKKCSVTGLIGL